MKSHQIHLQSKKFIGLSYRRATSLSEFLSGRIPQRSLAKLLFSIVLNFTLAAGAWAGFVPPSNLTATSVSSNSVSFAWTDNSSNEKRVVVSHSLQATSGFSDIATLPANSTTYTDTGLLPHTTYYYQVSSVRANSIRVTSSTVSVTTATDTYTITTSASPAAGGTTSGGGSYARDTTVTVTATPNSGYSFVSWMENGTVVSTSAGYTFTAVGNRNLVANFTATPGWAECFGSGSGVGHSVATDASDNIFVAGYFTETVNFGGVSLTSAGGQDIFVAKYQPNGALIWAVRFGGTGDDTAQSIAVDRSGNVVVTGSFNGAATIGNNTYNSYGGTDAFLLKLSGASGVALWAKQFGYTGSDSGYGVAVDPNNGNVVVTGEFTGMANFGGGWITTTGGGPDAFLAAYDSAGSYLWAKNFSDGGNDYGQAVAVDPSGDVLLAGNTSAAIDLGGGLLPFNGGTNYNSYVGKFTSSGSFVWGKCFGNVNGAWVQGIAVDGSGNVALSGYYGYGTIDFGSGCTTSCLVTSAPYIVKLSGADGTCLWATSPSPSVDAQGTGIAMDPAGDVVAIGVFNGTCSFGSATLTGAGGEDIYAAKYSSSGANIWAKGFGGGPEDMVYGVALDAGGNSVLTGYTYGGNFGGQTLTTDCSD